MAELKFNVLCGKLNPLALDALTSAYFLCKTRGNPRVELVHWLQMILQLQDSDLNRIVRHFELNRSHLDRDLVEALDELPRGSVSKPSYSFHLDTIVKNSWSYASLLCGENQIRTGHLLLALVKEDELSDQLLDLSSQWEKVKADDLSDHFVNIISGSPEEGLLPKDGSSLAKPLAAAKSTSGAPAGTAKESVLESYSVDLIEKARKGEIDPVVGRDEEVRFLISVLLRRRQNNPVLVGEAGVGKTAIAEGFALRIVAGDVPPSLKDVSLRALDVVALQAGASMKGEFEKRLRAVIEEVQKSTQPIILFIDEVHTLIGAGGSAGTGDAANLLKPALARGTLRTIAATTWDEYRKHIEKDPALSRRFEKVLVEEPSEEKTILMLRRSIAPLEKCHKVQILDEALAAAVRLSKRFIPARQLPDKAVSLIDTACANVAVSQHAVPARLEDARHRIDALDLEHQVLTRESAVGVNHQDRLVGINQALANEKSALTELEARLKNEKALVDKIIEIRSCLRAAGEAVVAKPSSDKPSTDPDASLKPAERDALLTELQSLQKQLAELQGDDPLLFPCVDQGTIAAVVTEWTGIPVGRMARQGIRDVLNLADHLEQRVIGQRHALDVVARSLQNSRAKLSNPNRPVGVFLFVGPSGTGKTETALAIAEALFGTEQSLLTINMGEFQEEHTVSTLKGAPPGYVGYGEGGILTEPVRRRPYTVVLLDEVEKAHPNVHRIFFQVFDKGWMEDAEGRFIDFRNSVIILTSNAAQDVIINQCQDPDTKPDAQGMEKLMREPLLKFFPDALLNRLVVVPYYPLSKEMLDRIIKLNLARVEQRLKENHQVPLTYDASVLELITERCNQLERGARMIESMITQTMLPAISREILLRSMDNRPVAKVHIGSENSSFTYTYD
jgi:type VI secretion system protein VasG